MTINVSKSATFSKEFPREVMVQELNLSTEDVPQYVKQYKYLGVFVAPPKKKDKKFPLATLTTKLVKENTDRVAKSQRAFCHVNALGLPLSLKDLLLATLVQSKIAYMNLILYLFSSNNLTVERQNLQLIRKSLRIPRNANIKQLQNLGVVLDTTIQAKSQIFKFLTQIKVKNNQLEHKDDWHWI